MWAIAAASFNTVLKEYSEKDSALTIKPINACESCILWKWIIYLRHSVVIHYLQNLKNFLVRVSFDCGKWFRALKAYHTERNQAESFAGTNISC